MAANDERDVLGMTTDEELRTWTRSTRRRQ